MDSSTVDMTSSLSYQNWTISRSSSVEQLSSTMSFSSTAKFEESGPNTGDDTPAFTTEDVIILIGTPLIFIPGILGNVLSAIVMNRRHFRSLSTGVHLFCLAVADSIFLSVNSMTKNFIRLLFGVDLTKTSAWSCKIYVFLLMTFKCLGAWLIVAVTLERLVIVRLPLKAKVLATRRRAWLLISLITLISCCLHIIVLVTYGLVEKPWGSDCTMMLHYRDLGLRLLLTIIDLVTYSLLPSLILFGANIVLIYSLIRSNNFRRRSQKGGDGGVAPADNSATSQQATDDVRRLTITLVAVSITFLVCTSPNSLLFLIKTVDPSIVDIPDYSLLYRAMYLLQLSNSAINFVLYCASGPAFRRELKELCLCCPCVDEDSKG